MKRFVPFLLAILGTTFAVAIMFVVMRNEGLRAKLPVAGVRESVADALDKVTDLIEEEITE
jgi:hypothetical protein